MKSIEEKWLNGWCLSRNLPPPLAIKDGFMVNVGWPQQKTRYVFPRLTDEFYRLAEKIKEPWHFLKVCAEPEKIKDALPAEWSIQSQGYMMTCRAAINFGDNSLPIGFQLEIDDTVTVPVVKILTDTGELAAIGRIAFVDDVAIYDRIETNELYRRKGLATFVLQQLEQIALSRGITKGVLVATEQGKKLYEFLGWELHSYYTSVVITGNNTSDSSA